MIRSAIRRLLALDDPPERTALAFAIGVFIGFSPFLGLHTIIATIVAFVFRFNKVAIYAGAYVNNPLLTLIPVVLLSYGIGAFLLGRPFKPSPENLHLLAHPHLFDGNYWRRVFARSGELLLPFGIGGMTLSVIGALVSYPLLLHFLRARQKLVVTVSAAENPNAEVLPPTKSKRSE